MIQRPLFPPDPWEAAKARPAAPVAGPLFATREDRQAATVAADMDLFRAAVCHGCGRVGGHDAGCAEQTRCTVHPAQPAAHGRTLCHDCQVARGWRIPAGRP